MPQRPSPASTPRWARHRGAAIDARDAGGGHRPWRPARAWRSLADSTALPSPPRPGYARRGGRYERFGQNSPPTVQWASGTAAGHWPGRFGHGGHGRRLPYGGRPPTGDAHHWSRVG